MTEEQGHFWKGICFKGKKICPQGEQFLSFNVDPFSKRKQKAILQSFLYESVLIPLAH